MKLNHFILFKVLVAKQHFVVSDSPVSFIAIAMYPFCPVWLWHSLVHWQFVGWVCLCQCIALNLLIIVIFIIYINSILYTHFNLSYNILLCPECKSASTLTSNVQMVFVMHSNHLLIDLLIDFLCLGRIHSAVITKIDWKSKSVTVEWSEADEIKGKEVCIRLVSESS